MIYTVCILQCIWEIKILYQKCCRLNYLNKKNIFKDLVFISYDDICVYILILQIQAVITLLTKPKIQQILIIQHLDMTKCK